MIKNLLFISIVAPAYACSECIPELYRRVVTTMESNHLPFELIIVNDNSPQCDWEVIVNLSLSDKRLKAINFSRNFGQHAAICAGIDYAVGDWVVVMDCDLEDQPEEIPRLLNKALTENFDIVFACRDQRSNSFVKNTCSRLFRYLLGMITQLKIDSGFGNFSIASKQVMDVYRALPEKNRSHGLILLWCGFEVGYIHTVQSPRFAGQSSYTFGKSFKLAFESIISHSNYPLQISIKLGLWIAIIALLISVYFIFKKLFLGVPVSGWSSLIVSIYLMGGLIIASIGILGLYLGEIFNEIKKRPLYIIREKINFQEN
ncbi:MAG: glycosyltransferase family 2 protein [Pseudomonadota bacterium]